MHTLEQLQELLNSAFEKENFIKKPENLYLPIDYTLRQGGKRIRPTLMLAACEMFDGNIEDCISAAIGLEIFHNFTLLHDDIMDQSPMRRGMETVYKKWNTNTAILSGDVMYGIAFEYFLKNNHPNLLSILNLFTKTTMEICDGQQLDVDLEKDNNVTVPRYIEMIRLKTAVLLASALRIGACYAYASEEDQKAIYDFGIMLGLAFQLQDDWLDCYGNQHKLGKTIGLDIADNKKTFLYTTALAIANPQKKDQLKYLYSTDKIKGREKQDLVIRLFDELDIKQKTLVEIEKYHNEAIQLLESIGVASEKKEVLRALAERLLGREY